MNYTRTLGCALVLAGFAGWMVTADWKVQPEGTDANVEQQSEALAADSSLFRVATRLSVAGTIEIKHSYIGRLAAPDTVTLIPQVGGTVRSIQVSPGQVVQKGAVLFHIESDTLPSRIQKAKSSVRESQEHYDSIKRLVDKRFASVAELNAAKTQLDESASNLRALEEELDQSEIKATVTGALPLDLPKEGTFVAAGEPLVEIAKVSDKKVRVLVPPSQAGLFRAAKPGDVTVSVGQNRYEGKVRAISSVMASDGASIAIDVDVKDSREQLAGEIAHVRVIERIEGAHTVEGSQVEIGKNGQPMVKAVEANTVYELPLDHTYHGQGGLIVQGWPGKVETIIRGGGFVTQGETVIPTCEVNCDAGA